MDFLPFRAQSFRGHLNFFFQNENAAGIVVQLIKQRSLLEIYPTKA